MTKERITKPKICEVCSEKLTKENKSSIEPDKLCVKCYEYAIDRAISLPANEFPIATFKL